MSGIGSSNRRRFLAHAAGAAGVMMIASQVSAQDHHETSEHLPPEPANGKTMDLSDGGKLYYIDSGGDGEVVLLLHSMTGSARVWEHQWDVLKDAGYRVIAYSRRGHWGSSPINPANMGTGAQDLKDLMDGLGIKKFHAMGTAGGGYYLNDFAVKWHGMLTSMTLACSILAINEPDFVEILRRPNAGVSLAGMPSSFLELSPNYRAGHPEGRKRWEALEHVARYDNKLMQPLMHGVTWEEVGQISCPVQLIAGGSDFACTPTVMDYAAPRFRNAVTHVINNVGHSAHWEDPRTFNTLLLNFLTQHGTTA